MVSMLPHRSDWAYNSPKPKSLWIRSYSITRRIMAQGKNQNKPKVCQPRAGGARVFEPSRENFVKEQSIVQSK
jgi:hypothetical protein